jgi:hypothetical protein
MLAYQKSSLALLGLLTLVGPLAAQHRGFAHAYHQPMHSHQPMHYQPMHYHQPMQLQQLEVLYVLQLQALYARQRWAAAQFSGLQPSQRSQYARKLIAREQAKAGRFVQYARKLINGGEQARARSYLEDVLKRWPNSPAAKDASKLLTDGGGGDGSEKDDASDPWVVEQRKKAAAEKAAAEKAAAEAGR